MKLTIETKTLRQVSEILRERSTGLEIASAIDSYLSECHRLFLETVSDYLTDDISKSCLANAVATEQRAVLAISFPENSES